MKTRREFLAESAMLTASAFLSHSYASASKSSASPNVSFPSATRDRIAVASYPFRDFIVPTEYPGPNASSVTHKMELAEFGPHVSSKFGVNKIEPWSRHFRSLEPAYLDGIRSALDKAKVSVANIAFDGEHSFYAVDQTERDRAITDNKNWIDAAARIGSPNIRTHVAAAENQPPDLGRCADTLLRIADYAAERNVVVHLENDDGVTEDPIFLVKVIEKANSPWLGALPDFGNSLMHKNPADAYAGVEAMFKHAYGICHVKESESTEQGANVLVDLPYTFAVLRKAAFRGYLSIEYDNSGDPYSATAELIAKTLHFLP